MKNDVGNYAHALFSIWSQTVYIILLLFRINCISITIRSLRRFPCMQSNICLEVFTRLSVRLTHRASTSPSNVQFVHKNQLEMLTRKIEMPLLPQCLFRKIEHVSSKVPAASVFSASVLTFLYLKTLFHHTGAGEFCNEPMNKRTYGHRVYDDQLYRTRSDRFRHPLCYYYYYYTSLTE